MLSVVFEEIAREEAKQARQRGQSYDMSDYGPDAYYEDVPEYVFEPPSDSEEIKEEDEQWLQEISDSEYS